MKKLISLLLSLVLVASVATTTVSATSTDVKTEVSAQSGSRMLYFDIKSFGWSDFKNVYCHITSVDKETQYSEWGSSKELCTYNSSTQTAAFDVSKLSDAEDFDDSEGNCFILTLFTDNSEYMTFETLFGSQCFGDTLVFSGEMIPQPFDKEPVYYGTVFKNHPESGAMKTIHEDGSVTGVAYVDGVHPATVLAEFLVDNYYDDSILSMGRDLVKKLDLNWSDVYVSSYSYVMYLYMLEEFSTAESAEIFSKVVNSVYDDNIKFAMAPTLENDFITQGVGEIVGLNIISDDIYYTFGASLNDVLNYDCEYIFSEYDSDGDGYFDSSYTDEFLSDYTDGYSDDFFENAYDSPSNYTFKSDNTKIASVDTRGRIKGVSVGTAKITVTSKESGRASVCTVKVKKAPTGINIVDDCGNVKNNGITLGYDEYAGFYAVVSENEACNSYTWSTSNKSVLDLYDELDGNEQVLIASGTGTAYLTVKAYNGVSRKIKVVVKDAPTSVSLSEKTITLGVGEKFTISESTNAGSYSSVGSLMWDSDDYDVADIEQKSGNKAEITANSVGTTYVTITTHNFVSAKCKVVVKPAPSSVKLSESSIIIGNGESFTISESTNSGSYANASNLKWSTSNSKVATVQKLSGNKAKIVAKGTGTATITIKTYNGKTASCKVTVKSAPSSVKLSESSIIIGKGESFTISESTNSGSYANASNLKWSTSNSKVATVQKLSGNKAKIVAKGIGTATITIKTYNGKTASCKVTVKAAPTSVKLNKTSLTLGNGESITISESTNSGSYSNASNLKWSTSNSKVATVQKLSGNKAKIVAKGTGTATITIKTYNGKTASCKVTVKAAPNSVKLSTSSLTLKAGQTYVISESTNSGSYANADNLKWTSSNTKVASVKKGSANKATITAKAKGTANITLKTYNGKTATCKVTVK